MPPGRPAKTLEKLNPAEREVVRKKDLWLKTMREHWDIRKTQDACGIPQSTAYYWKSRDKNFSMRWDRIRSDILETLVDEAKKRAVLGWKQEVYQGGKLVGYKTMKSDSLLMFLIKAYGPTIFRDNAPMPDADSDKTESTKQAITVGGKKIEF